MASELQVQVTSNAIQVASKLGDVARRQLPFATALALSRLAGHVQRAEREQLPRVFKIRGKRVQNDVRMDLTRKREWPNPAVHVGHRFGPMELHERGGTKRPLPAFQEVFVPTRIVESQRSESTGRLPQSLTAASLLRRGLVYRGATQKTGPGLFLRDPPASRRKKGETTRVAIRGLNRGGKKLRMLYLIRPTVKIRARYGFEKTAQLQVNRRFDDEFRRALDQALATAR
jgi:hypothetical protein